MSEIQISLSPDLARLEADRFCLRIVQGSTYHLLVEGMLAVNRKREVVRGIGGMRCRIRFHSRAEVNEHTRWF